MNIEEIRKRHEADERGDPSFGVYDEQTHKDRAELLKLVEQLEAQLDTHECYRVWLLGLDEDCIIQTEDELRWCPTCKAAIKGEGDGTV